MLNLTLAARVSLSPDSPTQMFKHNLRMCKSRIIFLVGSFLIFCSPALAGADFGAGYIVQKMKIINNLIHFIIVHIHKLLLVNIFLYEPSNTIWPVVILNRLFHRTFMKILENSWQNSFKTHSDLQLTII